VADVQFFPHEDHPGFRCIGGDGLPEGDTRLIYEGADPASGEETSNEFIMPFEIALAIASEFLRTKQMAKNETWYEL